MANLFVDLPAPPADGAGASVDVSGMGRERTFTVQDAFRGTVNIQFSNEGAAGPWATALTFTAPGKKTIDIAARFMRVMRSGVPNVNPGLPNIDVASNDIGGAFVDLPVTPGDGVGATINTAALGTFNTVTCQDPFRGAVIIEISEDGVDWSECMTFSQPGWQSKEFVAQFMRVRRRNVPNVNPGLPNIDVGAINDAGTGSGGAAAGGVASQCFIFRPGSMESGPVVFGVWADLITALGAARANSNGSGCYEIFFDPSITTPISIPSGTYDMTNVEWVGDSPLQSIPGSIPTTIFFGGGATQLDGLRKFRGFIRVECRIPSGFGSPIRDLAPGDIVTIRERAQVLTDGIGIEPFFDLSGLGSGDEVTFYLDDIAEIGDGANSSIDQPTAGSKLFLNLGSLSQIRAEALDIGASAEVTVTYRNTSARVESPQTLHPSSVLSFIDESDVRHRIIAAAGGVLAVAIGDLQQVDPTAGAVTVNLPAITRFNEGNQIIVKNITALVTAITITPAGGDTVDGAATLVMTTGFQSVTIASDGSGNWLVI